MTDRLVQPKRCATCGGVLGATQRPLTRVQANLLRYVCEQIAAQGYAPTFAEISAHFQWRSLATAHEHLQQLELKGYIRRGHNEERAITVLVSFDEIGTLPMETKHA